MQPPGAPAPSMSWHCGYFQRADLMLDLENNYIHPRRLEILELLVPSR